MPTTDRRQAISLDDARHRAGALAFPSPKNGCRLGGIGLEPEFFPVLVGEDGGPAGRLPLRDPVRGGVLELLDAAAAREARLGCRRGPLTGPWEYYLTGGGRLTFEPGAQVEHSTAVHHTAAEVLADVAEVEALIGRALAPRRAVLAAIGLDLWHDLATVPQQLQAGRYLSQAAFYEQRGPSGGIMMRHTASLQINLDLGPEGIWQERWRLANLLSPLITACFASSPSAGAVAARAQAWQELDPSRSGFPRGLMAAGDDPRGEWGDAALAADVMLFRLADGSWHPGHPGFDLASWIRDGHPCYGWPTVEDVDYHLTTLFFEVRPRGFLELRAGEELPASWRAAPVVLTTALLYDDEGRRRAIELLDPVRGRLDELWRRAAADGVADSELQGLADGTWQIAFAAAERLPDGWLGDGALDTARRFYERFTARGRTPSHELAELSDPARTLAWATGRIA